MSLTSDLLQIPVLLFSILLPAATKRRCSLARSAQVYRYDVLRQAATSLVGFFVLLTFARHEPTIYLAILVSVDLSLGLCVDAAFLAMFSRAKQNVGFYGVVPSRRVAAWQTLSFMLLSVSARSLSACATNLALELFPIPDPAPPVTFMWRNVGMPAIYLAWRYLLLDSLNTHEASYHRVHEMPLPDARFVVEDEEEETGDAAGASDPNEVAM